MLELEKIYIMELAQIVAKIYRFSGNIICDLTKPDGTMQKLMDVSRLMNIAVDCTYRA